MFIGLTGRKGTVKNEKVDYPDYGLIDHFYVFFISVAPFVYIPA